MVSQHYLHSLHHVLKFYPFYMTSKSLILYQSIHADINACHLERAGILIVQLTGDPFTVTGNLIFRIVVSVLQNWPPMRYIVAVEQELISQNTIVKVLQIRLHKACLYIFLHTKFTIID